jgi:hypothetical protein
MNHLPFSRLHFFVFKPMCALKAWLHSGKRSRLPNLNLFRSLWTARWQGLQFLNWHNHGLPPNHFHQGEHARGMARVREIHNRSLHLKLARRGYEDAFRIGQKNIVD